MLKRTFLTALSAAALALAVPSMAAAAHHSRTHHRAHHARTHHHSHHKAAAVTTVPAPVAGGQPAVVHPTEGTSTSQGTTPTLPAPAGTVTSFTAGVLTISLTGGGTQSGLVTEETSIECVSATPPPATEGDDGQAEQAPSGSSSQFDAVHTLGSPSGDEQGQDGQGNQQEGQDSQDGPEGTPCTTAALTPGAVVRIAELNVTSAGAVWDRIEIIQ